MSAANNGEDKPMSWMKTYGALAVALVGLAGCTSPVVGLTCRDGFVECSGVCVDTSSDPFNCGGCGIVCASDEMCISGMCTGEQMPSDAGTGTADPDGGTFPVVEDAGIGPSTGRDAGPRPTPSGCGVGALECSGECVDAFANQNHCGACGATCAGPCVDGTCQGSCDPPNVMCGSECVDTSRNWRHCGGCDIVCDSHVCENGECLPFVPGHVVVVGHDFTRDRWETRQIAGNAVFLAPRSHVRVASYVGTASRSVVNGVRSAVNRRVEERGGSWSQRETTPERASLDLAWADVFAIYPQRGQSDEELVQIGANWGVALDEFTRTGGVVVLFNGPGSVNGGSQLILEGAGLLEPSDLDTVAGMTLQVDSPGDAVMIGVPESFEAGVAAVGLQGMTEGGVVASAEGLATVVHRVTYPEH